MKLEGHYTVAAPQASVWSVLQDPALLARILPGCEKLELLGENKYGAAVKLQIGPLQGAFTGAITLSDIKEPDSYRMSFDGKGALGFVKGTGTVHLVPQGSSTRVEYAGDATIGGRIASVGQRLVESSARALIEQTFDTLTPIAQSITPAAPPASSSSVSGDSTTAPPPVTPMTAADVVIRRPSQVEFGMGVLKHMFEDAVPEPYRVPVLAGLGLLVLLMLSSLLSALFDN